MIALYSISQTYCHVKQFLCMGTVPPLGLILIIPLLGQTSGSKLSFSNSILELRFSEKCSFESISKNISFNLTSFVIMG